MRAFVGLMLASILGGCSRPAPPPDGKIPVVATFSVLGDFAREIGGDRIKLTTLVGPDGDAHVYQPTPADVAALADAKLLVLNGAGFEGWLDKLVESSGTKAFKIDCSAGMELLVIEHEGRKESDPHVWHDAEQAAAMAGIVAESLGGVDPTHLDEYRARGRALTKRIMALDAWIKSECASIPPERRKLVTSHDTFGYFARRYGFRVVGSAIPSVSTEAGDPSAKAFAELIETVKAAKVPAVFAEASNDPRLIERLGKEAGVKVVTGLFTDALGVPGSGGETYEAMMRANVAKFVGALKEGKTD